MIHIETQRLEVPDPIFFFLKFKSEALKVLLGLSVTMDLKNSLSMCDKNASHEWLLSIECEKIHFT